MCWYIEKLDNGFFVVTEGVLKKYVAIMMKYSSLAAPEVAKVTSQRWSQRWKFHQNDISISVH